MPYRQQGGQPEQSGAAQQALGGTQAASEAAAEQQQQEGCPGSIATATAAADAEASGGNATTDGWMDISPASPENASAASIFAGSSNAVKFVAATEGSAAMPEQAKGGWGGAERAAAAATSVTKPEQAGSSPVAALPAAPEDTSRCTILDLPDHLIANCLESLEQAERLNRVALVSKRFAALSLCANERRVNIKVTGAQAVERARQVLLWLPRNAPLIKYLGVEMAAGQAVGGQAAAEADAADVAEMDCLATCCLSAFGVLGGGQLEQLTVEPATVLSTTAWLPTLRRLERLRLGSMTQELLLTGPLHLMAAAVEFELAGAPIKFGAGVQLPPSLTRLQLRDKGSEAMPAQVAALTNLEELQLHCRGYSADSMAGICSLPALTDLTFNCFAAVPTGLAGMTQLVRLEATTCTNTQPVAGLEAALSSLTGLRDLHIAGDYASVLPALTALSKLEKLGLSLYETAPQAAAADDAHEADAAAPAAAALAPAAAAAAPAAAPAASAEVSLQAAAQPSLPIGPYLGRLRDLQTSWDMLANSLPALEQATRLEFVLLDTMPDPEAAPKEHWEAAFKWLAQHPPLQELSLAVAEGEQFSLAAFDALMHLKDRRPGLKVARGESSWIAYD